MAIILYQKNSVENCINGTTEPSKCAHSCLLQSKFSNDGHILTLKWKKKCFSKANTNKIKRCHGGGVSLFDKPIWKGKKKWGRRKKRAKDAWQMFFLLKVNFWLLLKLFMSLFFFLFQIKRLKNHSVFYVLKIIQFFTTSDSSETNKEIGKRRTITFP